MGSFEISGPKFRMFGQHDKKCGYRVPVAWPSNADAVIIFIQQIHLIQILWIAKNPTEFWSTRQM